MDEKQKILLEELLFSGIKRPGFAKKLFFGQLDHKNIFPFPDVSPEEKEMSNLLINQFKEFADKHLNPVAIDKEAHIPAEVIEGLGELGILGMTIPKEYGGLGRSQYAYCKIAEELSSRCGSTTLFVNAHQSIGLKAILLFGTDKQKEKWLPRLSKGYDLAAFALTEPNAGSDANGIEARAIYDSNKDVYRISGRKQWITNGAIAKVLTVMAKTEDDKVTAFLVTPDMPGFKVVEPALDKVGMRGSKTAILDFENVEVPTENILGPKGGGLKVCLTVLDYGRTTFGAACTGAAKYLIQRATEHAIKRHQFNRPLASFPLVKEKIAKMHCYTYAMDASTYLLAGMVDSQVEDIMLESAIVKVFTSDSLWQILYDTMQIFGGRSFFTDEPFERMMRDARLNMIGEGSNEVLRAFIGVVGARDVGVQLKHFIDALKHPYDEGDFLKAYLKHHLKKLWLPEIPIKSLYLKQEATAISKLIRRFGNAVIQILGKYREDVIEQQLVLNRISTSVMALYSAIAVLSKSDNHPDDYPIAKLYCREAIYTIEQQLNGLFKNEDSMVESVSDKIVKKYEKVVT